MDKKQFTLLKSLKTGTILKKCGCFTAHECKCISVSVRIQIFLFVVDCGRGWKIQCSFTKVQQLGSGREVHLKTFMCEF